MCTDTRFGIRVYLKKIVSENPTSNDASIRSISSRTQRVFEYPSRHIRRGKYLSEYPSNPCNNYSTSQKRLSYRSKCPIRQQAEPNETAANKSACISSSQHSAGVCVQPVVVCVSGWWIRVLATLAMGTISLTVICIRSFHSY